MEQKLINLHKRVCGALKRSKSGISSDYIAQLKLTPNLEKLVANEADYNAHLSLMRLYSAVRRDFGKSEAEELYQFEAKDLVDFDKSFKWRNLNGTLQNPLQDDYINTELLVKLIWANKSRLLLSTTPMKFFQEEINLKWEKYDFFGLRNIPQEKFLKYTGFRALPFKAFGADALRITLIAEMKGKDLTPRYNFLEPQEIKKVSEDYLKYRDILLSVKPDQRRYLFLSGSDSVLELSRLKHRRHFPKFLEGLMACYPYGLPNKNLMPILACGLSTSANLVEKMPPIEDESGSLYETFGFSDEDFIMEIIEDEQFAKELIEAATSARFYYDIAKKEWKLDPKYSSRVHSTLWAFDNLELSIPQKQMLLKTMCDESVWNAILKCLQKTAFRGVHKEYLESIKANFKMPIELTSDVVFNHYRHFMARGETPSKAYPAYTGFFPEDALFFLADDYEINEAFVATITRTPMPKHIGKTMRKDAEFLRKLFLYLTYAHEKRYFAKQGLENVLQLLRNKSDWEIGDVINFCRKVMKAYPDGFIGKEIVDEEILSHKEDEI